MNRIILLSALFGIAMTGAAAAATASVAISPNNGSCPAGFDFQKGASSADDVCVQSLSGTSGSGPLSMASFSGGDDNDHGHGDHDSDSD